MAGILNYDRLPDGQFLTGQTGAAPFSALYPTQAGIEEDQAQLAREKAAAALQRRFRGASMGAPAADAPAADTFPADGAPALMQPGISGQMDTVPFGALAPAMPARPAPDDNAPLTEPERQMMALVRGGQADAAAPQTSPAAAPVAPTAVPVPQPRPAAAPAGAPIDLTPPDQAALPPNAQPTVGQAAPVEPQAPSLLSKIGGKLNDNANLLIGMGAGFAGAPSIGTGISRGLAGAGTGSQLDVKQGAINQTVAALQKRGLPEDVARAAAANPAILQQILPQVFGAKQRKFTQIGEDMMGNKQFGFVDEASGKAYGMDGQLIEHGNGASSIVPTGPDGQPLAGPALMAHLEKNDPVTAAGIKGLISGDLNAQGRNLQKLAPLAKLVDPTFDAAQYPVRLNTRESYTSGKDFQETQALNTVGGHLGKLMTSAQALNNTNMPILNKGLNWFADTFTGSPALVKFRNDLVTTSNELAKAYHGGHVSDSSYAAFNKAVNEAQTPAELKTAIGELGGLLQSKIEAKESGYRSSMANAPLPSEYRSINDEAKHSFQRINDWANGTATPAAAAAGAPGAAPAAAAAPVAVASKAEYDALPPGRSYVAPDGSVRTKQ